MLEMLCARGLLLEADNYGYMILVVFLRVFFKLIVRLNETAAAKFKALFDFVTSLGICNCAFAGTRP